MTRRTNDEPKRRRPRGSGGMFQKHLKGCAQPTRANGQSACECPWWISYVHAGKGVREPAGRRKGDAERLLQRRIGAREHGLPVIPRAEALTFDAAAKDLISDFSTNKKRSLDDVQRRIDLHLTPFFGGRRLIGITATDVRAYVAKRQGEQVVLRRERIVGDKVIPAVTKPTENSTINRELQLLKRAFSIAIQAGRIPSKPHIQMLKEPPARSGFFDDVMVAAVVRHLPEEVQPVIRFAFITGWRLHSEILPLQWKQVDLAAGEVRLFAGQTKNNQPRTFPLTSELRVLLEERKAEHDALKKAGHIVPWVFWRMVAEGRGGEKKPRPIIAFAKAWRKACESAGLPGRIPHDLRRSAVRSFVRAGLSEHVAMRLSGHLTASVFRRYDVVSEDDLRSAAQALDHARGPVTGAKAAGNYGGITG